MSPLRNAQIAVRDTIAFGPAVCPVNLFGGSADKVIRGLKVHANTISFARLTSLEASFPRARDWIGDGVFNDLSRRFIEGGGGTTEPLAQIGRDFSNWLAVQGQDPTLIALVRFEWLWLQSYHAAEADAMVIGALAGKNIADILTTQIARHPAAHIVANEADLAVALGLGRQNDASAILVTRSEEAVMITPISPVQESFFHAATTLTSIGDLLETAPENSGDDRLLTALIDLITEGAFILQGDDVC